MLWIVWVSVLGAVVNFLLLLGSLRMCGQAPCLWKLFAGAALCGIYYGVCACPGMSVAGGMFWHLLVLGVIGWWCCGVSRSAVRPTSFFLLLHLALEGVSSGLKEGGIWQLLLSVAGFFLLYLCTPGGASGQFVPVELSYGGQRLSLTALTDTGNTLRDPLTGDPVMVVGAQIAKKLLGLTEQQLRTPSQTLCAARLPGMRLIPYKTVDTNSGMLLAMMLKDVKIGNRKGSSLVAFAPGELGKDSGFQALVGGTV